MSINIDTAVTINTLANAASQLATTAVGKRLEQVIDDLLPSSTAEELASLQISSRIQMENLELLRGNMTEITLLVREVLPHVTDVNIADDLRKILAFSDPGYAGPAA